MQIILKISEEDRASFLSDIKYVLQEELTDFKKSISNKPSDDETYFSRQEACKFLRCSLATLHNYQKAGKLTYLKIGRKVLFKKSELISTLRQIGRRGEI